MRNVAFRPKVKQIVSLSCKSWQDRSLIRIIENLKDDPTANGRWLRSSSQNERLIHAKENLRWCRLRWPVR